MKNSTIFFTILLSLLINVSFANGSSIDIKYDSKGSLKINSLVLTDKVTAKDLVKEIGKPSRKSEEKNGQIEYFYDDLGIVVGIKNNIVKGIGINFNWDGDKKFPETSYTGKLSLDNHKITVDSKNEDLSAIETVIFDCPFPMMCLSKNEDLGLKIMVGFNKEKALSQFVFMLD